MSSIPTHKDWTAIASVVVQAVAVGLCLSTTAEALDPGAFLQRVTESVSDLPLPKLTLRAGAGIQRTLVQQVVEVEQWANRPIGEVFEHFYNGAYVMETTPVVLWSFLKFRDDPERALVEVVKRGYDSDTNAAMLGNLLGALHGESGFPDRWRGSDLESTGLLRDLATNLYRVRWPQ